MSAVRGPSTRVHEVLLETRARLHSNTQARPLCLRALADPARRAIVQRLSHGPAAVGEGGEVGDGRAGADLSDRTECAEAGGDVDRGAADGGGKALFRAWGLGSCWMRWGSR